MLNFVLRFLFKNFSNFTSVDVTPSVLRQWRIFCIASEKFDAGLRE
jgi:hypothetical protein